MKRSVNALIRACLSIPVLLLIGLLIAGAARAAFAQTTTQVIVLTGDSSPDGNGIFGTIFSFSDKPALNNAGEVTFLATLTGTMGGASDNSGIFRGDAAALTPIVRKDGLAPNNNGTYAAFDNPALNGAGQAVFEALFSGTSGGASDDNGIFLGDGINLKRIARGDGVAPDGNGIFAEFGQPAVNNAGQAAFLATFTGTSGGASDNGGVFRGDGTTLKRIARKGETASDGNGQYLDFTHPALNSLGQAAFQGFLSGTSGGTSDDSGIFLGDGTTLIQIVREGGPASDGNGVFDAFGSPALNDSGLTVFAVGFRGTLGGTSDNEGIYAGDGTTLTQVVREGDAASDGNGLFSQFGDPALNDADQAAFVSSFTGASGGAGLGMVRYDGATLTQIARGGDAAPDGNGFLSQFGDPALNNSGQVAFFAALSATPGGPISDFGIFFYDDALGLLHVARQGDPFLGSTIANVSFADGRSYFADERSGLNDVGQVAYAFELDDGREGVAIWSVVPEPAAAMNLAAFLCLTAAFIFLRRVPFALRRAAPADAQCRS